MTSLTRSSSCSLTRTTATRNTGGRHCEGGCGGAGGADREDGRAGMEGMAAVAPRGAGAILETW